MNQVVLKSNDNVSIKPIVIQALQSEQNELKTGILKTKAKLSVFEKKYNMSTATFLKATPDSLPFNELEAVEWSGEYETLKRLEDELSRLMKIELCS
ncbi:MAG: hypothetical protein A2889_03095 [Nitrospinae bacterium RIFCSPLOWO2_01_FULL_39_10]|nr:hypothetical protein [Nitrospinota bacterium]OGW02990.1 MAG: hypothetical protein A2889_03095 [Nitrospinae bacterium RIFCSPLOWO2_01_FULL_39_10]